MFGFFFVCICFFFFKQKTAYEMRISDWSSDVCSSDLVRIWAGGRYAHRVLDARRKFHFFRWRIRGLFSFPGEAAARAAILNCRALTLSHASAAAARALACGGRPLGSRSND